MECDNSDSYIFNTLKKIILKQEDDCNLCEQNLGISPCLYNTIPLMFMCKSTCNWFIGSGVFKDIFSNTIKCFQTPVFRVAKIDQKNGNALLELLQPQTVSGEIPPLTCKAEVCQFFSSKSISKFIRTGIYIRVDINCFSGIECLSPVWAKQGIPKGIVENPHIVNVKTEEYITISNGKKRIFLNSDGIEGFNVIPDPITISYSNLFVNGMLQPPSFYTVMEGKLILNTEDIPILGTFIILQLIKISK